MPVLALESQFRLTTNVPRRDRPEHHIRWLRCSWCLRFHEWLPSSPSFTGVVLCSIAVSTISTQPLLTGIDELESSSPLVLHVAWPVCLDGGVRSSTRCLLVITKVRGIAAPLIASGFRPVRTATGAAPSGSNHAPLTPYVSSASGAVS